MLRVFATLIFLVTQTAVVLAAGQDCSKALLFETYKESASLREDYRLSQFVSKEQWEQASKEGSGHAKLFGVSLGGSYEEYKANSKKMIESVDVSFSREQATNVAWAGLGPNSLKAYEECIGADRYGLYLYVRKATATQVEIVLKYRPTTNSGDIKLSWTGAPPDLRLPEQVGRTGQVIVVSRPTKGDILLGVNVIGDGPESPDAVHITAWPGLPPRPPEEPCVKQNKNGECLKCAMNFSVQGASEGYGHPIVCPNMAPGAYTLAARGTIITDKGERAKMTLALIAGDQKSTPWNRQISGERQKQPFTLTYGPIVLSSGNTASAALRVGNCQAEERNSVFHQTCSIEKGEWQVCSAGVVACAW